MATEPTHPTGLSAETRAVVAVVLEALDIPYAATVAHAETRTRILGERVLHLVVILRGMLQRDRAGDVSGDLEYLREKLAENPAAGYVTDEQARARCDAGAGWMDAVRLDYDGTDDDEGDVPAPDADGRDDKDARARRTVDNILYLADRGPAVQQQADANRAEGRTGVADALDAVADAHDRLADAVGLDGDVFAAVDAIAVATANAKQAIAAARAAEGDTGDAS
ncbi:hypothetical protein [Actinomadura geliboluensis]|uniref:hypothetical protein n=1 Tax=Actinomadura geliboluensis TaxID=882440 RepID=UPI0037129FC8